MRPFRGCNGIHLPGIIQQGRGDHRDGHDLACFGDPLPFTTWSVGSADLFAAVVRLRPNAQLANEIPGPIHPGTYSQTHVGLVRGFFRFSQFG